jgi:hypothetical protein
VSRDEHPLDDYVRRAARISDEQISRRVVTDARSALFEGILAMPTGTPAQMPHKTPQDALNEALHEEPTTVRAEAPARTPARRVSHRRSDKRGWKRPLLVAAVAAAVAATTAAAIVITTRSPGQSSSVECVTPTGSIYAASVTGDPVTDCATLWRRTVGGEPPGLKAYANGHGGVAVLPDGTRVPGGYTPLKPEFRQDPRLIELQASLEDYVDGLSAGCLPDGPARAFVTAELRRLGLTGWTVVAGAAPADGVRTCARYFSYELERRRIVLGRGSPHPAEPDASVFRFAARIRQIIATCRPADDAARQVRAAAEDIWGAHGTSQFSLDRIADPAATCTRADMSVGGTIMVVLRGPAARS